MSAWLLLLLARCLAKFDTSVICHVLMHCLGSFLLEGMFLSFQAFASTGQNRNCPENVVFLMIKGFIKRFRINTNDMK